MSNILPERDNAELVLSKPTGFDRISARYSEMYVLRGLFQMMPSVQGINVGAFLDSILAGAGANWQYRRLEQFVEVLSKRISILPTNEHLQEVTPSEPLYDFVVLVLDHVIRARSEQKRSQFANLLLTQMAAPHPWDEAEVIARLLGELSDTHIQVLLAAVNAPVCDSPFDQLKVVTVADPPLDARKQGVRPVDLRLIFPGMAQLSLRMYCSELIARGLLLDEGIGRLSTRGMTYFAATDLAEWFLAHIAEPEISNK